ncbi:hypothetical protein PpBr36_03466 [Pyricularia pennisetigena]|uniref:hypothetical protein n=1 Tax=Pyricularia pennisetigena TaxID=1578925 RepID=UPI0011522842|nr:hypothetical protein PpBr36_03466 [Pyricularia pennisetigena]TLS30604.1 hypothetical protein PpBr36_03466 [Pyricularia pennisetigena]
MKFFVTSALLALAGLAAAEVPQEHSHEFYLLAMDKLLQDNNPLEIKSSVFALLGNAAAAEASDKVDAADLDCLQQIIADQAFTNAKAKNDVAGMVNSLIFRTLERNTLTVGEASKLCTTVQAVNPEIAALTQIQDPASSEGQANNKQTILDLAVQIAAVGGDPTEALFAGTFQPGQIGDPTAAGNTCNDATDTDGCIFSQNLLVEEATVDEIEDAVAAAGAGNGNNNNNNNNNNNQGNGNQNQNQDDDNDNDNQNQGNGNQNQNQGNGNQNQGNGNQNQGNGNGNQNQNQGNGNQNQNQGGNSGNIQAFTGALGGAAPAVQFSAGSDRPFTVNGNTFNNAAAALTRSCDIQNNACFNAANGGQLTGGTQQCQQQQQECIASVPQSAAAASKVKRDLKLGGRRLSRR